MWMQRMERWEKYGKAHTKKPSLLLVHTQGEISRQTNRQKVLPGCSLLLINMMNTTPPGFTGNQKQVIADLRCSRLTRHSSCRKWGHRSSPSRMEALGGGKKKSSNSETTIMKGLFIKWTRSTVLVLDEASLSLNNSTRLFTVWDYSASCFF